MTWSPFFTEVTPGPTSTTTPAPSWPRIAGNRPSGSAPESVNSSVWQMPVALISTSTSNALGPSSWTLITSRGLPAPPHTAAFPSMPPAPVYDADHRDAGWRRRPKMRVMRTAPSVKLRRKGHAMSHIIGVTILGLVGLAGFWFGFRMFGRPGAGGGGLGLLG